MIKQKTMEYIAAFDRKDIDGVTALMRPDFALEDPVVKRIEGRDAVRQAVLGIFGSCSSLSFKARNIFIDGNTSLIEFSLTMDSTVLTGVDIIEWDGGMMKELRAYLDIPKS